MSSDEKVLLPEKKKKLKTNPKKKREEKLTWFKLFCSFSPERNFDCIL